MIVVFSRVVGARTNLRRTASTRAWCNAMCPLIGSEGHLGLHLQVTPYAEAKLVRCTRGRLYDVAVDLRKDSATFRQWVAVELSAENRRMLYVPEGMAHGFETLEDETEVFYQMSEFHHPEAARGVRWNDAALGIAWPLVPPVLSDRDRAYPDLASWPNSS